MFGYEFKFNDEKDDLSQDQILYGMYETEQVFPHIEEYIIGFYPDVRGVNYFSTTGKLSGIYGQAARIIAGIFGFGTYYDHTTSSIPFYSSTIYRNVTFVDGKKDYNDYRSLTTKPNLKKYYDNLYK